MGGRTYLGRQTGSPAWAGIDLAIAHADAWEYGFPRVGGDRPLREIVVLRLI